MLCSGSRTTMRCPNLSGSVVYSPETPLSLLANNCCHVNVRSWRGKDKICTHVHRKKWETERAGERKSLWHLCWLESLLLRKQLHLERDPLEDLSLPLLHTLPVKEQKRTKSHRNARSSSMVYFGNRKIRLLTRFGWKQS